jgi:hypothetical protein
MPGPAYYRKQAELFARLALANISDPCLMERYSAQALEYLIRADEAEIAGPMPPPGTLSRQCRSGVDHD